MECPMSQSERFPHQDRVSEFRAWAAVAEVMEREASSLPPGVARSQLYEWASLLRDRLPALRLL